MEASSIDALEVELFRLLRAARREESFVPLHTIAKVVAESLFPGEHLLLASYLEQYEGERLTAEVGSF